METYSTIVSKRDTRQYTDRPISDESLRRILQAGRMAGSSKNSQPCRFIVVRDAERKKELSACGQFAAYIPSAPVVIVVAMSPDGRDFDAGRATQNMMLAAWAEGITSCPVTLHDAACARRVLGLPEGHWVAIAIPFGYPPEGALQTLGQRRLPLENLVHYERW
ncbi:MAG: nitroreductase family protein [Dehalococcoidia bacterium]|nr:nitroreductase family protein [Dehalococcoidia bacterium]